MQPQNGAIGNLILLHLACWTPCEITLKSDTLHPHPSLQILLPFGNGICWGEEHARGRMGSKWQPGGHILGRRARRHEILKAISHAGAGRVISAAHPCTQSSFTFCKKYSMTYKQFLEVEWLHKVLCDSLATIFRATGCLEDHARNVIFFQLLITLLDFL